jgi:hypothetical protein
VSRHQFQQNLNYHNKINFYLNKQGLLGIYIKIGVGGTNPKQAVKVLVSHHQFQQNLNYHNKINFYLNKQGLLGIYIKIGVGEVILYFCKPIPWDWFAKLGQKFSHIFSPHVGHVGKTKTPRVLTRGVFVFLLD